MLLHHIKIGDRVLVTPLENGDEPTEEFVGGVVGFKDKYIQVRDGDDNVFDCEVSQLTLEEDDQEEQRRDEKRGLYPDKIDIAN